MIKIVNNGYSVAHSLHENGLLQDDMCAEDIEKIIKENAEDHPKHLLKKIIEKDDFWEDLLYTAEELGYKLKI